MAQLLAQAGIPDADIVAEPGEQALRSAEDWWTVVLGSGYRWTAEQMDPDSVARVRAESLQALRDSGVSAIETNVLYAVATKP